MITTRDIDVDLEKGIARLDQKTTKDVDVSFKTGKPKKKTKSKEVTRPQSISTHNMPDVADILEKKKRDEIIAEMKMKEEGSVKMDGKGLEKLNRQFVFIDMFCEDEIQAFPRKELK